MSVSSSNPQQLPNLAPQQQQPPPDPLAAMKKLQQQKSERRKYRVTAAENKTKKKHPAIKKAKVATPKHPRTISEIPDDGTGTHTEINQKIQKHNEAVKAGNQKEADNLFNDIAQSVGLQSLKGKEAVGFFRKMLKNNPDKILPILINMVTKKITEHGLGIIVVIEIMTGIVSLIIEIIPIPEIGILSSLVEAFGEALINTITALGPENLTTSLEGTLKRLGPMIQPIFKETANMVEQVFGSIGCCNNKKLNSGQQKSLEKNVGIVSTALADKILPILYDPNLVGNTGNQQKAATEIKKIISSTIAQINAADSKKPTGEQHLPTGTGAASRTSKMDKQKKDGGGCYKTRRNKHTRKRKY